MIKRVGMTTDVERRQKEREYEYGKVYHWKVVASGLTREKAQAMENEYVEKQGYKGNPGGRNDSGRSWDVYTFETAF